MVIVDVVGCDGEDPPPHPISWPQTKTPAATKRKNRIRCRRKRRQQSIAAIEVTGISGKEFCFIKLALLDVLTVSVVVAATPDGVTIAGEKAQVAPAGKPEQVNEAEESKPFCGVIVTVVVPLCLASTVIDAGETVIEKSGGGGRFMA